MRFVREISHGMMDGLRFQSKAMAAIQEAAENLVVREFESIPPCELQITMYMLTIDSDEPLRDPCEARDHSAEGYEAGASTSAVHDRLSESWATCRCAALMGERCFHSSMQSLLFV
jgi:hypothetical protein